MTLQMVFTILSLALSIGSFVRVFLGRRPAGKITIAVIISAVVILGMVALCDHYLHQRRVKAVEVMVVDELRKETRTFDQLYEGLFPVESPTLTEALDQLVNQHVVGHRMLELQDHAGETFRVRGYYRK